MNNSRRRRDRISYYYSVLQSYDPNHAYLPKELLKRGWAWDRSRAESKRLTERMKEQRAIRRAFMSCDRLLFHCGINRFLTQREKHRVQVHYNFLSQFVHPTQKGMSVLRERTIRVYIKSLDEVRHYDYLVCHLQLLYLAFLTVMYSESLIRMVRKASATYMKGVDSVQFDRLRERLLARFGYFWFIYHGGPSEVTKFQQTMQGLWGVGGSRVSDFRSMPDSKVRYYTDPVAFLKELSGAWHNKVLGDVSGPLVKSPITPF